MFGEICRQLQEQGLASAKFIIVHQKDNQETTRCCSLRACLCPKFLMRLFAGRKEQAKQR